MYVSLSSIFIYAQITVYANVNEIILGDITEDDQSYHKMLFNVIYMFTIHYLQVKYYSSSCAIVLMFLP